MGDRANIVVKDPYAVSGGVVLYTHWNGTELPAVLRSALKRGRERWTDDSYLARIIFAEMIKEDLMGVRGYGISVQMGDGDDRVLTVDTVMQEVTVTNSFGSDDYGDWPADGTVYSFDGYLAETPMVFAPVPKCACQCEEHKGDAGCSL